MIILLVILLVSCGVYQDANTPKFQIFKSDGSPLLANNGFTKTVKLIISGYAINDEIGVYQDSECLKVMVSDTKLVTTSYTVYLSMRDGANSIYVKRKSDFASHNECRFAANYFYHNDIPAPIITGDGGINIELSYDSTNIKSSWIPHIAIKEGTREYGDWIEFSNNVELKSMDPSRIRIRFQDSDGAYSKERESASYIPSSPCKDLEGEWVHIPSLETQRGSVFNDENNKSRHGFCVMKHHLRLVDDLPVSIGTGEPETNITADEANQLCKRLGDKFGLITNAQWMLMAINIEAQNENWYASGGGSIVKYPGADGYYINRGHLGADPIEGLTPLYGVSNRTHLIRTAGGTDLIWDLSGNYWDLIYMNAYSSIASNLFTLGISNYSWVDVFNMENGSYEQFVPQTVLDGIVDIEDPLKNLGVLIFNGNPIYSTMIRGGDHLENAASIFTVKFVSPNFKSTTTAARCTWYP